MIDEFNVHETRDRAAVRAVLARDPVATAYMLGDLADPFFDDCRWLIGDWRGRSEAVVLVYTGMSVPVLLSYGAPDAVEAIFVAHPEVLAAPCYAKIPPEHESAYRAHARVEGQEPLWVMGVTADRFRPVPAAADVERLTGATPLAEFDALYADYPGNFFEPHHLETGVYYGARSGGRLVSIAGTHVLAPVEGVAVLGNIVTAAQERGRGLGRAVIGVLVADLFERGCGVIALHVSADNRPAIACYRSLGFSFRGIVLQSRCLPR